MPVVSQVLEEDFLCFSFYPAVLRNGCNVHENKLHTAEDNLYKYFVPPSLCWQ